MIRRPRRRATGRRESRQVPGLRSERAAEGLRRLLQGVLALLAGVASGLLGLGGDVRVLELRPALLHGVEALLRRVLGLGRDLVAGHVLLEGLHVAVALGDARVT